MDEQTKQFAIRVMVLLVAISAFYYIFSPYESCKRLGFKNSANVILKDAQLAHYCQRTTSW